MSCSWRGRLSTATRSSPDVLALRRGERAQVLADRLADVDDADARGIRDDLVHVEDRRRVEHGAAVGDRDDRQRVLAPGGRERRAVDRVDRDVARGAAPVADALAVEEHRRLVLLALADHHDAVEVHGAEEGAHRVDRGPVGGELVAAADPRVGADGGRLGGPHQLERDVAVGVQVEG